MVAEWYHGPRVQSQICFCSFRQFWLNNQNSEIDLETDHISEVISVDNSVDNSLDNLSVKTVFKTKDNKTSETHSDYNSMNVQTLRQHLRNKLSAEGLNMTEASISKMTKKELIKHLS